MKIGTYAFRVCVVAAIAAALPYMSGCAGSGTNSNTVTSEYPYVAGTYTGTLTDSADIFGHGAAAANLAYVDNTPASSPATAWTGTGTLTFTDGTKVPVATTVALAPTGVTIDVSSTASAPSPYIVIGLLNETSQNNYSAGGLTELTYMPATNSYAISTVTGSAAVSQSSTVTSNIQFKPNLKSR